MPWAPQVSRWAGSKCILVIPVPSPVDRVSPEKSAFSWTTWHTSSEYIPCVTSAGQCSGPVPAPGCPPGQVSISSPCGGAAVGFMGAWAGRALDHQSLLILVGPRQLPLANPVGDSHLGSASGKLGKAAGFSMEQMCLMGVFVSGFLKVGCFFFKDYQKECLQHVIY